MSTIPEATMIEGRMPTNGSMPAEPSAETATATTVVTKPPAIWLKNRGTLARARPAWVSAAHSAATKVSPTMSAEAPSMMLTPTASSALATMTTGCW